MLDTGQETGACIDTSSHYTKMAVIKLNKENPVIEFKLNAEDSYLLIKNVVITNLNEIDNTWTSLISKIKLTAELKYIVYSDAESRYVDDRILPIHILPDPYQVQLVFNLNKYIRNETFTLGMNSKRSYYQILKLILHNIEELDDNYIVQIDVEKFKVVD